jgi:hypothetical protein
VRAQQEKFGCVDFAAIPLVAEVLNVWRAEVDGRPAEPVALDSR